MWHSLAFLGATMMTGTDAHIAVQQMGSDSWRVREAATAHLSRMGLPGMPAAIAGTGHDDPEVRARCGRIVGKFHYEFLTRNLPSCYCLPEDFKASAKFYNRIGLRYEYAPSNPIPPRMRFWVPAWKAFDHLPMVYKPRAEGLEAEAEGTRELIDTLAGEDWTLRELVTLVCVMRETPPMDDRDLNKGPYAGSTVVERERLRFWLGLRVGRPRPFPFVVTFMW